MDPCEMNQLVYLACEGPRLPRWLYSTIVKNHISDIYIYIYTPLYTHFTSIMLWSFTSPCFTCFKTWSNVRIIGESWIVFIHVLVIYIQLVGGLETMEFYDFPIHVGMDLSSKPTDEGHIIFFPRGRKW